MPSMKAMRTTALLATAPSRPRLELDATSLLWASLLWATLLWTTLLWASPALAQSPPNAPDPAAEKSASEHFDRGMQRMDEKRYAEACEEFKQSEYPEPTVATQYQLGNCHEQQEKYGTARRHYVRAADMATAAGDVERAGFAKLRVIEIDAKAAKISLVIPPEMQNLPALTILLDDEPIPKEQWGEPIAVDRGGHTIKVAAPGKQPATISVSITATGQATTVTLPPLSALGDNDNANDNANDGGQKPKKGKGALFWTGVGLTPGGGLLTAGGLYTVIEDEDTALGGALIGLGAACIATGVTFLVLFNDKDEADEPPPVTVEAVVSPSYGGLRVTF